MTDLMITLDPDMAVRLQRRAAANGSTVEDEARVLLRDGLAAQTPEMPSDGNDLVVRITRRFAAIGLKPGEELQRPDWAWAPPSLKA